MGKVEWPRFSSTNFLQFSHDKLEIELDREQHMDEWMEEGKKGRKVLSVDFDVLSIRELDGGTKTFMALLRLYY